jgi:hypothetical protein
MTRLTMLMGPPPGRSPAPVSVTPSGARWQDDSTNRTEDDEHSG